jgi:hypothetical protein
VVEHRVDGDAEHDEIVQPADSREPVRNQVHRYHDVGGHAGEDQLVAGRHARVRGEALCQATNVPGVAGDPAHRVL